MPHPFESIPPARRRAWLVLLTLAALTFMAVLNWIGSPLITPAAPYGIVSYELAGTQSRAATMLASWDVNTQLRAAFTLGLDYLFMPAYSAAIALACVMAASILGDRRWPLAFLGPLLAWGQALAAISDALENVGLTRMLLSGVAAPWPQLSQLCAVLKFALIFFGLVYVFYGLAARLAVRSVLWPSS